MICLVVTYKLKEGAPQRAIELFRKLAAESRKEPGCRSYLVHTDPEDERTIMLYEQYDDGAALARHRSSPHYKTIADETLPPLVEGKELKIYHRNY